MRYYQQVLREGETLLFAGRMHWIVLLHGAGLLAAGLVLMAVSPSWPADTLPHVALLYGGLLCVIASLAQALADWVRWYTTEIAVTDRRVIYKRGLIGRRSIEMNVSKIETVDVLQGPLARLLGYGDVIIHGVGGSFEPLRAMAAPIALRNTIMTG